MKRLFLSILFISLLLPTLVLAHDLIVTRDFTGLWDQPKHENQGINLQIVEQGSGVKAGVAYWFTYGDDMESAWFVGIGPTSDNRIEMKLLEVEGVGFLEVSNAEKNLAREIGSMEIEFSSCDDGEVTFSTDIAGVGSGMFSIVRLTSLLNSKCSGGISDDTPANVMTTEQRIDLVPARAGVTSSGHADFMERADRTEFSVEAEDLADGSYRIFVGGVDRGELVINGGIGETEFRSPEESGKILLTFDPRGDLIEVLDGQGAVLTSGPSVFDDDDDNGGDVNGGDNNGGDDNSGSGSGGGDKDFDRIEIEVEFKNTGVFPLASGDARLRIREDRTDFSVEIEDVPESGYDLSIGGVIVGTIQVGSVEGELEFRNPVEPGTTLLDFDPRGQQIDVLDGATVILEISFPTD